MLQSFSFLSNIVGVIFPKCIHIFYYTIRNCSSDTLGNVTFQIKSTDIYIQYIDIHTTREISKNASILDIRSLNGETGEIEGNIKYVILFNNKKPYASQTIRVHMMA